jgi:hypothetical protein
MHTWSLLIEHTVRWDPSFQHNIYIENVENIIKCKGIIYKTSKQTFGFSTKKIINIEKQINMSNLYKKSERKKSNTRREKTIM